jgi:hypothetical protein
MDVGMTPPIFFVGGRDPAMLALARRVAARDRSVTIGVLTLASETPPEPDLTVRVHRLALPATPDPLAFAEALVEQARSRFASWLRELLPAAVVVAADYADLVQPNAVTEPHPRTLLLVDRGARLVSSPAQLDAFLAARERKVAEWRARMQASAAPARKTTGGLRFEIPRS